MKPVFERINLNSLREMVGGDDQQFRQLAELFVRLSTESLNDLEAAFARDDREAIGRLSHTLKGSAGVVGASQLANLLSQVEAWAKGRDVALPEFAVVKSELLWVTDAVREGGGA